MDFEFGQIKFPTVRGSSVRDAVEATRQIHSSLTYKIRSLQYNVVDFTDDLTATRRKASEWKTYLPHNASVIIHSLENRPKNPFVDLLLADGRIDLAEWFTKILVLLNKTTWIFDKNLVLVRNPNDLARQSEFDDISTLFFCSHAPNITAEPEECIDLHAIYSHVQHPLLVMLAKYFAMFYRKQPDLESKFYTKRLLSRMLMLLGYMPSLTKNFYPRKALVIMPYEYFMGVLERPTGLSERPNLHGYILES